MQKNTIISIIISTALIAGTFYFVSGRSTSLKYEAVETQNIEMRDGVQYVTISAKGGYSPQVTEIRGGLPTKLIVKTDGTYDCSLSLGISSIKFQKILEPTGEEVIDLGIPKSGDKIQGVCGMGMYSFELIVSDDADYKDVEYFIEGQRLKIGGGVKYFGNELVTDLNNDGRMDKVFLVTQNPGGSGTFFYVVAALNTEAGYLGSDGYLLGDRIAPQTTEVSQNPRHKNVIVVNYADRSPNEPMTASPSIGKSAYLKLDTATMRWGIVVPNFEGEER